jgi:hypothetical protein
VKDLVKRINGLSDENDKLKKQLGMSQYTCQKMDDDLNSLKKQGVSMQRLMVGSRVSQAVARSF